MENSTENQDRRRSWVEKLHSGLDYQIVKGIVANLIPNGRVYTIGKPVPPCVRTFSEMGYEAVATCDCKSQPKNWFPSTAVEQIQRILDGHGFGQNERVRNKAFKVLAQNNTFQIRWDTFGLEQCRDAAARNTVDVLKEACTETSDYDSFWKAITELQVKIVFRFARGSSLGSLHSRLAMNPLLFIGKGGETLQEEWKLSSLTSIVVCAEAVRYTWFDEHDPNQQARVQIPIRDRRPIHVGFGHTDSYFQQSPSEQYKEIFELFIGTRKVKEIVFENFPSQTGMAEKGRGLWTGIVETLEDYAYKEGYNATFSFREVDEENQEAR